MSKNPALQNLLNEIAAIGGFKLENKHSGLCIRCGQEAIPRCTTEMGRREFGISGFCEMCWDEVFSEPEPGGSTEEDLVRNQQKGESDV